MRFVYAVINLLILAGLIYLVGRKSIVKIFRSRREKIARELDEAETPFAPEPLPEMPAPDDTALKSELAAAEKDGKAALAELDTQYEADAADQRREMLFTTRAQIIEQVLTLAEQHMRSAEYQASKLARQNEAVEQILAQIHLTPGDVSYISRKGVLYVTLTSAAVLPDEKGAHSAAQRGAGQGGGLLLWRGVCLRRRGGYRGLLGEQVGDGYLIAVADIKDLLHLRVAPSAFPFAHRLAGDLQLLGELLLCQSIAAPYRCQPITKCHMCPPLLSVPSVYGTPTEKSITFRLHFRKIVCRCAAHGATSGLHSLL